MPILKSLCFAVAIAAAALNPALAQTQTATTVVGSAIPSANLAKGKQIITNLKLFEILIFGGRKGLMGDANIAALPKADQDKLLGLFSEEMEKRRADTINAMATANAGKYTAAQLDQLVDLSKVKYVQDLVLNGGDPSLATPNEAGMTASQRALVNKLMTESWVIDFFTKFDYSTAAPYITQAAEAAVTRYIATR